MFFQEAASSFFCFIRHPDLTILKIARKPFKATFFLPFPELQLTLIAC